MQSAKIQILPLRRASGQTKAVVGKDRSPSSSSDSQTSTQKRVRTSKPKVKTGCLTCKIRKIKCDEIKPACVKCTSTGRKCDGYMVPPPRGYKKRDSTADAGKSLIPTRGIALYPMEASPNEMRALEYFCLKMAPGMGMHFDADFWNRFVIPASMAEPALRYAMVAVGIFAEQREALNLDKSAASQLSSSDRRTISTSGSFPKQAFSGSDVVALANYNKSISMLTRLASCSRETMDILLLACILFICVELLRGDDKAAVRHFQGGMKIIADSTCLNTSPPGSKLMIENVKGSIIPVFNRLEMLYALFGNDASWSYSVTLAESIPATFDSIGQARDSMVHLINLSLRFVRTIQFLEYQPDAIPISAHDEQATLLCHLQLWRMQFSAYQTSRTSGLTPDDHYIANVLEIQRIVAYTWISTCLTPYECAHDAHIPAYTEAVVLAEQLAKIECTRRQRLQAVNAFRLDVEIVGPLYMISVKCREKNVRRRAIAVLRTLRRREGVWDSDIAASIAEAIASFEEAGPEFEGLPSEVSRVHNVPFTDETEASDTGHLVTFCTKPFGIYEDWALWEEPISPRGGQYVDIIP